MQVPDSRAYSYLLGLYLGDGAVSAYRRTYGLRITLDEAYPEIIADARAAVQLVALDARVTVRDVRGARCVQVACHWPRWPEAFPQHGPGRKHERRIALVPWQQEIVDAQPWAFLRGLLHSDGCRTINRFSIRLPSGRVQEYAYPRWFFSNRSVDTSACSARPATASGSAGRARASATSACRGARASRCWKSTSERSDEAAMPRCARSPAGPGGSAGCVWAAGRGGGAGAAGRHRPCGEPAR